MATAQETVKVDAAELFVDVDVVVPHGALAATVASSGGLTVRTRIRSTSAPCVPEAAAAVTPEAATALRTLFNARRNAVDLLAKQIHNAAVVSMIPLDLARGILDAVKAERDAVDAVMNALPAPTADGVRTVAPSPSAQDQPSDTATEGRDTPRDEDAAPEQESNPKAREDRIDSTTTTENAAASEEKPLDTKTNDVEEFVSVLIEDKKCWKYFKVSPGGDFVMRSWLLGDQWSIEYEDGRLSLHGKMWSPLFRMQVCRFVDDDCVKPLVVRPEFLPKFLRALWKVNDRSVHGDPSSTLCAAIAAAFVLAKLGKPSRKRGTVDAAGFAAFVSDTSFSTNYDGSIVGRPKTQGRDRTAAVHRVKMGCRLSRGRGGRALVLLLPANQPGPLDLYEACTMYEVVRETRDEKLCFVEEEALQVARLLLLHGNPNEGATVSLVRFVFDWRRFERLEF